MHGRRKAIICFGEGIDYDVYGGSSGPYAMHGPSTGRDAVTGATTYVLQAKYGGWFSPTEGAAVGAAATFVAALLRRELSWAGFECSRPFRLT